MTSKQVANAAISEPLYLSYARRFEASRTLGKLDKRARQLCRLYIYLLGAYLCNLDLEASRAPKSRDRRGRARPVDSARKGAPSRGSLATSLADRFLPRSLEKSRWKRGQRFGWLFWLCLAWYIGSLVFLCTYTFYQYRYDVDLLRLEALDRLEQRWGHTHNKFLVPDVNRSAILANMAETWRTLQLLGPDLAHLTILVEACLVVAIVWPLLLAAPALLHHSFQRPFDQYHLVRELLDRPRETDALRRMVERQASQFCASSRVFYQRIISSRHGGRAPGDGCRSANQAGLAWALRRERDTRQAVREMLASGALTPLFRLQPHAKWRLLALAGLFSLNASFCPLVYAWLIYTFRAQPQPVSWHLVFAWLGALVFAAPTAIIHPSVVIIVTQEQVQYVAELRRMLRSCLEEANSKLLAIVQQVRQRGEVCEQLERTLNSNLLLVLLHYKLFVAQLRPLTKSMGVQNSTWIMLMLLWPMLMRLHQPYLTRLSLSWLSTRLVKIWACLVSLAVVSEANIVGGPQCHLFARCTDLYRELSSLAAHLSEAKLTLGSLGVAPVYDAHVESCLLLEIANSQRFLEPLKVRAWGITGTYSTLVRALFWYGIAVISILAEDSCNQNNGQAPNVLIALLNDPLGVYSQIPCT